MIEESTIGEGTASLFHRLLGGLSDSLNAGYATIFKIASFGLTETPGKDVNDSRLETQSIKVKLEDIFNAMSC
jgi:hypothetical protein